MKNAAIIIFFAFFLNACQSIAPINRTDLQGKWLLTHIQDMTQFSSQPFLSFKDDMVSGFSGCNHFMGQYAIDDNQLSFDALASTKKLCPPAQMQQEDALFALLEGTFSSAVDGNSLTLSRDNKVLIRLQKAP